MCTSTMLPEAIPLRNIKAPNIIKALINFSHWWACPRLFNPDQGSNFMCGIFQEVMYELNIKQYTSSTCHPQSQGTFERLYQTFNSMIWTCFYDQG